MRPLVASDPTSIGSYRLLGVLGSGGMGRVYLAQSPAGRRLAIKVIRPELAEDPVFRRRFAREVAAVRAVSPLFTAAVVDADTDAAAPWLATTYIEGPSLRDWVGEHGPLAPGVVLMLAAGLAEALASIHQAGLVHRDLKPGNVLLDDAGPRIIDFGIVVVPDATRLTTSMVGTPAYLAPELIDGGEPAPASDVFSLGATLFYAATSTPLVDEGSIFQQLIQISAGRFDLSRVPKELRPIIVRCLSRRPRDRPTADELARILVSAGVAAPGPGWYLPDPDKPPAGLGRIRGWRLSRRRMFLVGGGIGASVVVGGVGVAAAFDGPDGRPRPGTLLWSAGSGSGPPPPVPGDQDTGVLIIVDRGSRLIASSGSRVQAVDLRGKPVWTHDVRADMVTLRPWGDAVLVHDGGQLWLLDAATGTPRLNTDLVAMEQAASREDNPEHVAVRIGQVALTADHAFLDLGTATVAIDRQGQRLWRRRRSYLSDGRRGPAAGPLAVDSTRLVGRSLVDSTAQVSLINTGNGESAWSIQYSVTPWTDDSPPPGGGGPPPGGGPRPGGGPPPPGGGPRHGEPPKDPKDQAWQRSEARIGAAHVALRDVRDLRVVRLSDGSTVWRTSSPNPIVGIELAGGLLSVAADQITAYAIDSGKVLWRVPMRGARLAVSPDGRTIVAVDMHGVSGIDTTGRTRWQLSLPDSVQEAMPDRVRIQDGIAYVTFHSRPEQRGPLGVDVLAIAI